MIMNKFFSKILETHSPIDYFITLLFPYFSIFLHLPPNQFDKFFDVIKKKSAGTITHRIFS